LQLASLKEMTMIACRALYVSLALCVLSMPCVAQVQPGSTGGSIGKTDKSVSGGEEAKQPRVSPNTNRETGGRQTSLSNSCNALVGTWLWYRGVSEMTFPRGERCVTVPEPQARGRVPAGERRDPQLVKATRNTRSLKTARACL